MFYVDNEKNIPTIFSSFLLLFAASLLLIIAYDQVKRGLVSRYWWILGFGFAFMSLDEWLSFHERLIEPVHNFFTSRLNVEHLGLFRFAWVIPAIILIIFLVPYFYPFLRMLPHQTSKKIILAASIFLSGAIGTELIGGYFFALYGSNNFSYSMITTVEESLEMAGVILFIRGLMMFIQMSQAGSIMNDKSSKEAT
ncbi:hypothetical protein NIES208_02670 [[Limnothrix rosea] IAM M-220]|nr:hypothetical protein NIES208_02670 [[Limnothrix rosea] IAM M-220]